ncbi:MAG: hypothetical protein QOK15_3538 [Nocardioidaceae bacterium]|nr:hypothetical protein [Nocardioidaceae bacterium]
MPWMCARIEDMFEWDWVDELDGNATADRLAASRTAVLAAEAEQLVLATHWADLHAGDYVTATLALLPGELPGDLPDDLSRKPTAAEAARIGGRQRVLRELADGCPDLQEYAGAELAALLGMSTAAGDALVRDALAVRHRHPLLWTEVCAGTARVWLARLVARKCVGAALDKAHAEWVDAQTTPYLMTLPTRRFLDLVEAKIIEADPTAAEERARARALARFVRAGATDEFGLRTLVARASAGDVTYLVAVLDRIAGILAEGGDDRGIDVLRAEALRILGNPARALALLTQATLDAGDPRIEPADELREEALFPGGDAGGVRDATGRPLPGSVWNRDDLVDIDLADTPLAELAASLAAGGASGLPGGVVLGGEHAGLLGGTVRSCADEAGRAAGSLPGAEEAGGPALLRALMTALDEFDATVFDPVTVLHVHLSDAALTARTGVTRIEELGPVVLSEVRDWLTHPMSPENIGTRIVLRPVLDATRVRPVDAYEFPDTMSELATVRAVYEAFPYGTLRARACDNDHAVPYQHGHSGARPRPRGQTNLDNNAKLARFHHRLKTNGGWHLHHDEPGVYWWRTPHGHWLRVDPTGTHHHGRDPALDTRWLDAVTPAA